MRPKAPKSAVYLSTSCQQIPPGEVLGTFNEALLKFVRKPPRGVSRHRGSKKTLAGILAGGYLASGVSIRQPLLEPCLKTFAEP